MFELWPPEHSGFGPALQNVHLPKKEVYVYNRDGLFVKSKPNNQQEAPQKIHGVKSVIVELF